MNWLHNTLACLHKTLVCLRLVLKRELDSADLCFCSADGVTCKCICLLAGVL